MKLLSIAILSNNRFDLLGATINSILANVEYPNFELIVYNHSGTIGEGWNYLVNAVKGDYILMCQDDWYFMGGATEEKENKHWVTDAMEVLDNDYDIGIIRLRKDNDGQHPEEVIEEKEKYSIVKCVAQGFSMNPFLCRKVTLDNLGMVSNVPEKKRGIAEGEIRTRYRNLDYKTAKLNVRGHGVCTHIGYGRRVNTYKK